MRRVLPCGAPLRAMVRRWTSCSSQDWVGARVVHSHSRATFSRRKIHEGKMVRNTRANDSDESDQASNAIDDVCDDVQVFHVPYIHARIQYVCIYVYINIDHFAFFEIIYIYIYIHIHTYVHM